MLLVLLMTMATASLSASFAVFLVRERANKSKHVQTVSGAPPSAFWASVYLWDLINYAISAAGQRTITIPHQELIIWRVNTAELHLGVVASYNV